LFTVNSNYLIRIQCKIEKTVSGLPAKPKPGSKHELALDPSIHVLEITNPTMNPTTTTRKSGDDD
jgi:hypothetical protein